MLFRSIGYSLKVAKEFGWQAVGIEPNIKLEEYSRNVLKLNTISGYLSKDSINTIKEQLPKGCADYILIDNVLEHIPDPVVFFQNALSLLKPEGLIFSCYSTYRLVEIKFGLCIFYTHELYFSTNQSFL